jgi:hypothetical protein
MLASSGVVELRLSGRYVYNLIDLILQSFKELSEEADLEG